MPSLRKKLPSANALFAFEAAGRCGNFTKAAVELYVTQPAVSRMLARMEDHLGVKLFERVSGGIALTEDGVVLYRRISEGFRAIEAALDEIEARRTGTETVTLSISTAFTTHWLMPRMATLHKTFPKVDLRFKLVSGAIKGPVEDVDLGMRYIDRDDAHEHGTLVMPELLMPLCSPGYRDQHAQQHSPGGEDTIVDLTGGERDWYRRFSSFAKHGRRVTNVLELSDYAIVVQAALLGQGIALGWVNVASHWLRTGTLVPAVEEVVMSARNCHLMHPADKPVRPAVAEIRDWIIEEMKSDVAAVGRMYPSLRLGNFMKRRKSAAADARQSTRRQNT